MRTVGSLIRKDSVRKFRIQVPELVWEWDERTECILVTATQSAFPYERVVVGWMTSESIQFSAFKPAEVFRMFAETVVSACQENS